MADWRRGILTVVGYMIYVTWVIICGDDFLYAITDCLHGWVNSSFLAGMDSHSSFTKPPSQEL